MLTARRARWLVGLLMVGVLIGACSTSSEPAYRNSDGSVISPSLREVLRLYWVLWTTERPPVPAELKPLVPDFGYLQGNRQETSVTWIGHATTLVQVDGLNILTDPQFADRASPFSWTGPKRRTPPAMAITELPPIDVVLISHNHYDHLDQASVKAIAARWNPLFIVPLGVDALLKDWAVPRVVAMNWWEKVSLPAPTGGSVEVHSVPAHHWSARGLSDRNRSLWSGYLIQAPDFRCYFAGDTGYSNDFKTIGERFGPIDLALIPVGAYEPRDFMQAQHINPDDAVRVHQDVRAKVSVGIHWGTWDLSAESLAAPLTDLPRALQAAGVPATDFVLFKLGETAIWRRPRDPKDLTKGSSPANPKRQWRKGEPR